MFVIQNDKMHVRRVMKGATLTPDERLEVQQEALAEFKMRVENGSIDLYRAVHHDQVVERRKHGPLSGRSVSASELAVVPYTPSLGQGSAELPISADKFREKFTKDEIRRHRNSLHTDNTFVVTPEDVDSFQLKGPFAALVV